MITVAIVTRRLKEGKSYDDFRRAWFHTTGFGTANRMFTLVNAADPREITVIGMTEMNPDDLFSQFMMDVKERLANPLDEVIEPGIVRKFGVLVSEDDFSAGGTIAYRPPSIGGRESDPAGIISELSKVQTAITRASAERDRARDE
jgi:hypothetical protein